MAAISARYVGIDGCTPGSRPLAVPERRASTHTSVEAYCTDLGPGFDPGHSV